MSKFLEIVIQYKGFLVGLILSASLLWPLFSAPLFSYHDDVQIIRLHQMDKCFKDLQIPCRWVPDLGGLYGYPLFNYYGPLPYYFGEAIYLLSGSLIFSVKVMFAFSFVGSYIFMYLLGRKLWGDLGGSISGVFYSFAPYHAVDFYVRGAMGEMWGLMFFPALVWAVLRLYDLPKVVNLLLAALFIAFLITSHNLSAMLFLPIIVLLFLLLYLKRRHFKFLLYGIFSLVLGLALSSFYLLPMVAEKNLVHIETTTSGYFSHTEHFKGLRKLFLERTWGWGASVREIPGGERDGMSFQIGIAHVFVWLLTGLVLIKTRTSGKRVFLITAFSWALILISIFMINPRSQYIWDFLEPLQFLQFPWRFLILVIFFVSLIAGSVIFLLKDKRFKVIAWVLLILVVTLLNFSYFRPEKFLYTTDEELLTGENWDKQIKRSIFDYLPIYAKEPPAELADSPYHVLIGDVQITDFQKGTDWIRFKADVKNHTIINLSQYYFPNWEITANGEKLNFDYKNNHLGLMNFILGEGEYLIEARLHDTFVRSLSNFLSIVAFVLAIFLLLVQNEKIRNVLFYYVKKVVT